MNVTLWKQSALGASVGLPVSYSKHQSDCLVSTQPTKGHWASGHPHEVCSWWFVQRHSHQWLAGGHFVEVTLGVLIMFLHALLQCMEEHDEWSTADQNEGQPDVPHATEMSPSFASITETWGSQRPVPVDGYRWQQLTVSSNVTVM